MKLAITIVFLVLSVIMSVIILMQEAKSNGLTSSLTGNTETYWGKNKGRSKEATMEKIITALVIVFFALGLVLSIGLIK